MFWILPDIWSWLSRWTLDWTGTRTNYDGQEAIPTVLVISCPQGSIQFPQSRRSAQSPSPHFDSFPRSLRWLDYCLHNRSLWDPIGRQNTADQCCSSGRPQCLPCTPVSIWGYCPIRRPSSTFMPFQCWSISSTLRDQQHHKKITWHRWLSPHSRTSRLRSWRRQKTRWSDVISLQRWQGIDLGCHLYWLVLSQQPILHHSEPRLSVKRGRRLEDCQLVVDFEFVPVAVETSGIIGSAGCSLLTDIGRRISRATNDPRQMSYIFQQISVAIIRGNALAITASSRKYVQELVERHWNSKWRCIVMYILPIIMLIIVKIKTCV